MESKTSSKKRKKIESFAMDRIKSLVDNLTFDDLLAISIGVWAAHSLGKPIHFLSGSVAYKLARTEGNISQLAGLGTLGMLGIATLPLDAIKETIAAPIRTPETDEWYDETGGNVPFHLWKRAKMEEEAQTP